MALFNTDKEVKKVLRFCHTCGDRHQVPEKDQMVGNVVIAHWFCSPFCHAIWCEWCNIKTKRPSLMAYYNQRTDDHGPKAA